MNSNVTPNNSQDTIENPSTITATLTQRPTPLYTPSVGIVDYPPIMIPLDVFSITSTTPAGTPVFQWDSLSPLPSTFDINFNYMMYNTIVRGTWDFELVFKFFKIPGCQLTLRWEQFYSDQRNPPTTYVTTFENAVDTGIWMVDDDVEYSKDIVLPFNGVTAPSLYKRSAFQFPHAPALDMYYSTMNTPYVGFTMTLENPYIPTVLQPNFINVQPFVIMKPRESKDFLMGSYTHITASRFKPFVVPT